MPNRRLVLPDDLATTSFTRAVGRSRGLTTSSFRSAAVRRLAPGIFQGCTDGDPALKDVLAAHLHSMPAGSVVDGLSALQVHGIDLGSRAPLRFCVPASRDIRRVGTRIRRVATVPPSKGGVETPEAAFVAAAGELGLVELVVAGDWLVRANKTTVDALVQHAAGATGRHCRMIRRAAALVRSRVDSPTESRLRLCLVLAGLLDPVCNPDLGEDYFFLARPDLAYLRYQLLLEYEGDHHRTDRRQWQHDIERERRLRRLGYEVVRVTADTMRRPRALVLEVYELLVQRGYDGPAPVFSPEWLAYFEPARSSGNDQGSSPR